MPKALVRPDVQALLDQLAAIARPRLDEVDIADARQAVSGMRDLLDAPVGPIAVVRDLAIPGPEGATIPARLYDTRDDRTPGPVLVYLHGGGFVMGDLPFYEPLCAAIARGLDLPVVSVAYRLAPENPWPAAPDDCEAAARWVASAPAALGRTPTGLVLAGDSAGGSLTIITTLALRDAPAALPVLAQWPIYPAADLTTHYPSFNEFAEGYFLDRAAMKWFNDCYLPDLTHWRTSPLLLSQAGMPPTLVVTAGLDPLRDQGRAYAAACIKEGVPTIYREATGNIHGFLNLRKAIPSAEGDLAGCLVALRGMIAEADAMRGAAQGSGA